MAQTPRGWSGHVNMLGAVFYKPGQKKTVGLGEK